MADTPDDPTDTPKPKPRKDFKQGNTAPDGSYLVGKNRTPKHSRFAPGDGRKRGTRPKGQKNFDTELLDELSRLVTVRENGKDRRVTKLRSTIIRALDNASSKGHNPAIATIFAHSARIAEKIAPASSGLSAKQDELVDAFVARRLIQLQLGNNSNELEGDPEGGPGTEPTTDPVEDLDHE